ncbi:diacylglycerol/lipid kinase family protein [Deminuibacter soli]|uniref:DAGKc domain-containing protein n=1 Tax=Deminuibacter soli TaxID=2291815 RepID=A0A3E1NG84_9BACT|nr:diacylglycerol kinase family protein [Deminuibacter soli]RFM26841.1 hypothetical protein DXN05_17790 [Deminuibacter soli]
MPTDIHFIINPSAGTEEPVADLIREAFLESPASFDISITTSPEHLQRAIAAIKGTTQLVAVYGGDGTVMEAAKALHNSITPLFILPGGTANVMAKEIGMPATTAEALVLLASGDFEIKAVDMGIINGCPFLIRVNIGILADMITETSPETKERFGQWAYGLTAFREMPKQGTTFQVNVDGENSALTAVGLTVTNAGNIGVKGMSFLPGISVSDGWLDLVSLDESSILKLLQVSGSILLQKESPLLHHQKLQHIKITSSTPIDFLCDDQPQRASELNISIAPASLHIAYPKNNADETN